MEEKLTLQKLKRVEESSLNKAIRYYTILSSINDLPLTEREIQLVAFTAIKGNITYHREEFCKIYKSSSPTISNMVSKLYKLKIMVKDGNKIKVNPQIVLNFDNPIVLHITLNGKATIANN